MTDGQPPAVLSVLGFTHSITSSARKIQKLMVSLMNLLMGYFMNLIIHGMHCKQKQYETDTNECVFQIKFELFGYRMSNLDKWPLLI